MKLGLGLIGSLLLAMVLAAAVPARADGVGYSTIRDMTKDARDFSASKDLAFSFDKDADSHGPVFGFEDWDRPNGNHIIMGHTRIAEVAGGDPAGAVASPEPATLLLLGTGLMGLLWVGTQKGKLNLR